jgi:hypothetical protein
VPIESEPAGSSIVVLPLFRDETEEVKLPLEGSDHGVRNELNQASVGDGAVVAFQGWLLVGFRTPELRWQPPAGGQSVRMLLTTLLFPAAFRPSINAVCQAGDMIVESFSSAHA